jgi:hypothetical protein
MASLKLKINKQNRNKLYYTKFLYKAEFISHGIRFIFNSKNYKDCITRITRFNDHALSNNWPYGSHTIINLDKIDQLLFENVIAFHQKYQGTKQVTFLKSGFSHHGFTMYTNDVSILEELENIHYDIIITEAVTPPAEIMYFAKPPKYKYRVYLKSNKISVELNETLKNFHLKYHDKGDIWLSGGLTWYLTYKRRTTYSYLPSSAFIDYNDEQTLTLMHLLFGECLRKSYKLEKRP